MRLKRISLLALMSLVVAGGCSANRNTATSLRGEPERVNEPPRHDHEYFPSLTPDDDDFVEPPVKEPVPAPPALGISRVKSVSWLKDFGAKKRPVPAPDISCTYEELIGKCSPIEPCVPDSECGAQPPRALSSGPLKNTSPRGRMKKSMSRLLGRKSTLATTPKCSEFSASGSCTTADIPEQRSVGNSSGAYQILERHSAETVKSNTMPETPCRVHTLHPDCRKECLAEPLVESVFNPADPGLITPSDKIPPEPKHSFEPVPELPELNTTSPSPEPAGPTFPVPEAPTAEVLSPAPMGLIEPQLWPKLEERTEIRSISQSVSRGIRPLTPVKPNSASAPVSGPSPATESGPLQITPRPHQ